MPHLFGGAAYFLLCVFDCTTLSDKMYLDLSGIIHLVFNPLSNFSCNEYHLFVVYLLGNYHYADFTACLDSVGFLNALVGGSYFL